MRFLVIGSGFGQQHLEWISRCPEIDVRFLGYRQDEQRARALATRFGVSSITDEPMAVITSGEVDAVAVASPPSTHEAFIEAGLKAGLFVVSDKPLAVDAAGAARLAETAAAAGTTAVTTFQWRTNPGLRELRARVIRGDLGDIAHLDLAFRHDFLAGPRTSWPWRHRWETSGGGALGDMGVHLFDQLRWIIPRDWSVVRGTASVAFGKRQAGTTTIDCETDDIAEVLLTGGEVTARVLVSRVSSGCRSFEIRVQGTRAHGVVTASPDDGSSVLTMHTSGGQPEVTRFQPNGMNPYAALVAKDPELAGFADGYSAQVLLEEALQLGCGEPLRVS